MNNEAKTTDVITERVLPNVLSLAWMLLIFPTAFLTFLPINVNIGIALGGFITLAVAVSIWFSGFIIEFDGKSLVVGNAEVPLDVIASASVVGPEQAFEERGVKLSPLAFVRFQASVKSLLKVELNDPQDPTPYWLISSREANAFALAINAAKR